jgi:hypothetical protein
MIAYEEFRGYPQLAAFHASDPNFSLAWNPRGLRYRAILYQAANLKSLYKELHALDERDAKNIPYILQSYEYDNNRNGASGERKKLMETIMVELKSYGR